MNKDYRYWLNVAKEQKKHLDFYSNYPYTKSVIYYRGKYIYALKQAYKINPQGKVPGSVTGLDKTTPLETEIYTQMTNHRNHIDSLVKNNKKDASIERPTLAREFVLKIRRLSARVKQANFATNAIEKEEAIRGTLKDSASIIGTALKAPVMVTAKATSLIGPLTVSVVLFPFRVFSAIFSAYFDICKGEEKISMDIYNNTQINEFSDALKDGITKLSKKTYETVGRM